MPPPVVSPYPNWTTPTYAPLSSALRLILSAVAFATTLVILQVLLLQSGRIQALLSFIPASNTAVPPPISNPNPAVTLVITTPPNVVEELARLRSELAVAQSRLDGFKQRDDANAQLVLGPLSPTPSETPISEAPIQNYDLGQNCPGPGILAVLPSLQARLADRLFLLWFAAEVARQLGKPLSSKNICLASASLPADQLAPEQPLAAHQAFNLATWTHAIGLSATSLQSCSDPFVIALTFSRSNQGLSTWTDAASIQLLRSVVSSSSTAARATTVPATVDSVVEVARNYISSSRHGRCVAITVHPHDDSYANPWMNSNLSFNHIDSFGLSESVSVHLESRYGSHPAIAFIRTANFAGCSTKQVAGAEDDVCVGPGVLVSASDFANFVAAFATKIGLARIYLAVGRTGFVVDDDESVNLAVLMEDKLSSKFSSISNNSVVILENVLLYHPTNAAMAALIEWELAVRAQSFVGPGNDEDAWAASVRLARQARNPHVSDSSKASPLLHDLIGSYSMGFGHGRHK